MTSEVVSGERGRRGKGKWREVEGQRVAEIKKGGDIEMGSAGQAMLTSNPRLPLPAYFLSTQNKMQIKTAVTSAGPFFPTFSLSHTAV